ncbi:hypothetical protein LEP1GSC170_0584, partial [Leptospira interrogans serovar Bataviae str. HAI135]
MYFQFSRFFWSNWIQILFLFLFYVSIQAQDENPKTENKVSPKESPNTIITKDNTI